MHPVLFEIAGITIYSYGFFIAIGAIMGFAYMVRQGKKEIGLTFDQANSLFLFIFLAAFVGGKIFLFFEDIPHYASNPQKFLTGRGFVFYGSFLFAIPTMLWFFKKHRLPAYAMLDVMAVTTCLVHFSGRLGCFMAGCCFGKPTTSALGVVYTDKACQAEPLNTPLFPTQPVEAFYILMVMTLLLNMRGRKKFHGQLFVLYLMLYAAGRFILEYFRGDLHRGFVIREYVSHAQFIALIIFTLSVWIYIRWSRRNAIVTNKTLA